MGNSEVGHLNIGAGRVVYQDLVKINKACESGDILKNQEIINAYSYAQKTGKKLHLMGLTSTGGVHSSLDHLFKLIEIGKEYGLKETYVHCFMDGRDTDPKSGKGFIEEVQACCDKNGAHIASIVGRFYAMDRDKRWNRVKEAYDLLVEGKGKQADDMVKAMQEMTCIHPEAEQMIWDLSRQLGQVGGRKTYGYLPKPMKKLVDEIVDQMARLPTVDTCYQTWWELQCQVEDYYSEDKKRIRPPLSQQKEFRQIKNAVIKEAEHIRMNKISFEDADMQDDGEQISTYGMSYECQDLQSVANDESYPLEERDEAAEQLEQLAEDGDAYAQYIIGTAYRDGGLLIPDTAKAQKVLGTRRRAGLGRGAVRPRQAVSLRQC